MAEFKLSRIRFRWVGEWSADTDYAKDDIVEYEGKCYTCLTKHTSRDYFYSDLYNEDGTTIPVSPDPYWKLTIDGRQWKGSWIPNGTQYNLGEIVKYQGVVYICIGDHQSTISVESDIRFWRTHVFTDMWKGDWTAIEFYSVNDVVKYHGILYRCTTAHNSNNTTEGLEASIINWEVVSYGEDWKYSWQPGTRYRERDIVKYGGLLYRCTDGHTSANLEDGLEVDLANWEVALEDIHYVGDWAGSDPNATPAVLGTRYRRGDLVKFGAGLWRCEIGHTSEEEFYEPNWSLYIPGLEFENQWNASTFYQKGDVVRYGGYLYTALNNNINTTPSINDQGDSTIAPWKLLNNGFNVTPGGEWETGNSYLVGTVVRRQGQVYVATKDNSTDPNLAPEDWELVIPGEAYQKEWLDSVEYAIGDLVLLDGVTYRCIQYHTSEFNYRPDNDYENVYWVTHIIGDPLNRMRYTGDIRMYGVTEDGSTIGSTRLPAGEKGQILTVNSQLEPSWQTFGEGQKIYYVSTKGEDIPDNGDSLERPWRTIKYAAENITGPATIFVKVGTYHEILPIRLPRDVALVGEELRSTVVMPLVDPDNVFVDPLTGISSPDPLDYRATDMFYVNNGTGIRNMTLRGKLGTLGAPNEYGTRRPTGGAYVSLDPGSGPDDQSVWITNKSCYVQNVTTFGDGCVGLKIDGALHGGGNKSIVANDFTQICSGGIGVWVTNKALSELVSVFSYYAHIGYLSENGGKIRATNGNSSYGDYGCVAEGVDVDENPISGTINNRDQDAIVASAFVGEQGNEILQFEFEHAGENYTTANYTIVGSGANAQVVADEFRDGGMFNVRLQPPEDSTGAVGGRGFITIGNNAQGGDDYGVNIAANDENDFSVYGSCRIIITSGTGVGQYGYVQDYNIVNKYITVYNEESGQPGWGHIIPGYPIEPVLDTTTVYRIEPRVVFEKPPFTFTETTLTSSESWVDCAYGNGVFIALAENGTVYKTDGTSTDIGSIGGSDSYSRIKFGGGNFVVMGSGTNSYYSTDGTSWTVATKPNSGNYNCLAYGEGQWIAASPGSNTLLRSFDGGQSWSEFTRLGSGSSAPWVGLAYGAGAPFGDVFVLLASDGQVAYSYASGPYQLGDFWIQQDLSVQVSFGDSAQPQWSDITYGNGRFVAIANGSNAVAYSFTGSVWNRSELPYDDEFKRIAYGQGVFMVVGGIDGNRICVSDGGYYWEEKDITSNISRGAVGFAPFSTGAAWIVLPYNSTTATVINCGARARGRVQLLAGSLEKLKIWEPGSGYKQSPSLTLVDPNSTEQPNTLNRIGNGVLGPPSFKNRGVGYRSSSTRVTVSGDGYAEVYPLGKGLRLVGLNRVPRTGSNLVLDRYTWTDGTLPINTSWSGGAYARNLLKYVAVGASSQGVYSTNGAGWVSMTLPSTGPWVCAASDTHFVIAKFNSDVSAYSADGQTWTQVTLPASAGWTGITYGNGKFVLIAEDTATWAVSSDNGQTWTEVTTTVSAKWSAIEYGANAYVAIAKQTDAAAISSDGENWLDVTMPDSADWTDIAYGNGKFVAIANGSDKSAVSADGGNTWTGGTTNNTENWIKIGFAANKWFALSGDGLIAETTTDGITWKEREIPIGTCQLLIRGGGLFIILGFNSLAYANDGTTEEVYRVLLVNNVSGSNGDFNASITVSPEFNRANGPDHDTSIEIREKYSQVRLTGHDFLEIGTGTFEQTNYPTVDLTNFQPDKEVYYKGGGRVFYTSTDQDGNFRVGELFAVEQATGIVTISADYFDLNGLSELQLGGIRVGGTGVVIREFSTDATFSADSNNVVPTQKAIKAYIERRISGGGSNAATGRLIAGTFGLGPDQIFSSVNGTNDVLVKANLKKGASGMLLAHQFFTNSFDSGLDMQEVGRDLA